MARYRNKKMKYTLEEVIKELKEIQLVNPYHMEMVSNGHGEYPDGYKLTEKGAQRLKETLEVRLTTEADDRVLYSDIEDLIIRWNIDGTKTAGSLTRQIMEAIKSNQ